MYYACVNHLHTTPIVIIMKGCLQQPLPRNLLSDVWHMVRHVRTQRIDVECIVQPNRTCNSVTFGRHAQLKNNKQTCVVYYIAYSTVQNILVHTFFFCAPQNHSHTTPIVILQPLLRNLFGDLWHIARHVWTQRIDVQCIVRSGVGGALPCAMHV